MKQNFSTQFTKAFLLLLITGFSLFNSCQREEEAGLLNPQGLSQGSLLGESKTYFQREVAGRPPIHPDGAIRHQTGKTPVWNKTVEVQTRFGQGLKAPLQYQDQVFIEIGRNKELVPLEELSYLFIYTDRFGIKHTEVVIRIPDNDFWERQDEPGRAFSGIIIVEDWWGRPIKTFKITPQQQIIRLGSPVLSEVSTKENTKNLVGDHRPCEVITSRNSLGMYEVEYICPMGSDNGPGNDGPGNDGPGGHGNGGHHDSGGSEGGGGEGGGGGIGSGSDNDENHEDLHEYNNDPMHGNRHRCRDRSNPRHWCTNEEDADYEEERNQAQSRTEFLSKIDDSALKPCFKAIITDVKRLSNGSVAGIIQKFAGDVPGYNWRMEDGNLPLFSNGQTSTNYDRITGTVITKFDTNKFTAASELAVVTTILHEAVHAYLVAYFETSGRQEYGGDFAKDYKNLYNQYLEDNGANNANQHKEMSKSFVSEIVKALKEFSINKGYNLASQYYNDLAWSGLSETKAFLDLSPVDRNRILNLSSSEMTGYDLNNTFIGIKGRNACNGN